jgi:hypothetical protein
MIHSINPNSNSSLNPYLQKTNFTSITPTLMNSHQKSQLSISMNPINSNKISPIEKKLGIENIQVGFPLLIVPSSSVSVSAGSQDSESKPNDYLSEEIQSVCQTGLFTYLNDMIKNAQIRMPLALQQAKTLRNVDLTNLPYKIVDINGRKNAKEECPAGRMTEIRQIKMAERLVSDNPMERICLTTPDDFLASIIHIPIVPDLKWKQFCITLTQFCPQYKDFVISALTWPKSYFDSSPGSINNTGENEMRLKTLAAAFDQIRMTTENLPVASSGSSSLSSPCSASRSKSIPLFLNTVTNSNFLESFAGDFVDDGGVNDDCSLYKSDNRERCYHDLGISLKGRKKEKDKDNRLNRDNKDNECSVVNTTIKQFEHLREIINSLDNPAYVETLIYGLTSLLSHNDCTHIFPKLYSFGRGQETNCLLTDPQVAPTWKQFVAVAYSDSYYQDILAMHSSIDLDMLMEDLFQIIFGLDFAQHALGFIHGDLDIRHAVGYLKIDKGRKRMFKWHGRYFKLPGNGRVIKINKFKNASIMINNVTHSADFNSFHHQHSINNDNKLTKCDMRTTTATTITAPTLERNLNKNMNTFNTDLVRLAATLCGVLAERQIQVHASSPQVEKTFWTLMNRLVHCGVGKNQIHVQCQQMEVSGGGGDGGNSDPKGASIANFPEFRLKCLQEDDSNNEYCTWNSKIDIPDHTINHDALPMEQMDFFKIFEVDQSSFSKNPDHLIYTLD